MNTRLTLADVRPILAPMINPSNTSDPLFLPMLNEVCERIINNGKWKGSVVMMTFDSSTGFITLPYDFAAVLALTYNGVPSPVFTQFHRFVEGGPGEVSDTQNWPGILIDLGDGFATQTDPPAAGVVRVYSSGTDDGKVIRLYGELNGDVVFDSSGNEGENVILSAPFVATTNQFTSITGAAKPLTAARVRLKSWDGTTETQVAEYQPNEKRPMYHRYQTGVASQAIHVICHRRFIPIVAETDWVIPGNLSALRAGIQSYLFEGASDNDAADVSMSRAYAFLNDEAKTYRAGGRATLNMQNGTGMWDATIHTNMT